jgi:hypothetical protein
MAVTRFPVLSQVRICLRLKKSTKCSVFHFRTQCLMIQIRNYVKFLGVSAGCKGAERKAIGKQAAQ